jgi:hypothetical protein
MPVYILQSTGLKSSCWLLGSCSFFAIIRVPVQVPLNNHRYLYKFPRKSIKKYPVRTKQIVAVLVQVLVQVRITNLFVLSKHYPLARVP